MEAIYTPENTTAAFQINWSIALFGKTSLPDQTQWLAPLKDATEIDGVRILTSHRQSKNTLQFLVSTRPATTPSDVIRSVKGRLQYIIRDCIPKAFRRNYHIESVGAAKAKILDQYVACQATKHRVFDQTIQARLEAIQFYDVKVDLKKPLIGTYGQYLNSLQIVVENTENWHKVRETQWRRVIAVIIRASKMKGWLLSRIGLVSNHIHILLGAAVTESPQSVALSIMNNIAYVYEMTPILKFSFYVGTFGGYDRGVVGQRED